MAEREELIRKRAFDLWETKGRPDGFSDDFWLQAEQEIDHELDQDAETKPLMSDAPEGAPGTTDQRPRWEGPPENRPRGFLPAKDDPSVMPDAAGETLKDPDRSDLSDAFSTRKSKK